MNIKTNTDSRAGKSQKKHHPMNESLGLSKILVIRKQFKMFYGFSV